MEKWLEQLKMGYYKELFAYEGFRKKSDVENLKKLTRKDLEDMGIKQRG